MLEFEALVKVAFADQGDLDGLRTVLRGIREDAERRAARTAEYAEEGGPHPDRLPVIALTARLLREQDAALLRWAEWAEAEVARWDGVTPRTGARVPPDAFRDPAG
ncbi:hypothetical protein AB0L25_18250 [Spirillospora sp. NPDC052242]